jgi:conjugal transfer pilus assembly protein TrbC
MVGLLVAVADSYSSSSVIDIKKYKSEALALEQESAAKIEKYQGESYLLGQQSQQIIPQAAAKELGLPGNKAPAIEKYIFISFSMPDEAIKNLLQQAKAQQVIPILRGFKDNSYKKTFVALEKFVTEIGYGVSIDPELFAKFEITQVPSFVIAARKDYICPESSSCAARRFYKITGNTTVEWALAQLNAAWGKR